MNALADSMFPLYDFIDFDMLIAIAYPKTLPHAWILLTNLEGFALPTHLLLPPFRIEIHLSKLLTLSFSYGYYFCTITHDQLMHLANSILVKTPSLFRSPLTPTISHTSTKDAFVWLVKQLQ